ncbi:aldo/keto reductase [Lacinutrix jangbogonensis]|uniref:aldo/keto reductase n=1 Tax=Lacinutrix jangbogonensis TaxID=1469557 RepID=UPI00053D910B|nr:aldo/keto reductase [Lacinutrix jangbogonensis]
MSLGLGTAALGRPHYINVRQERSKLDLNAFRKQSFAVLENAYQLGVRYFDTAPGYGLAEDLLLEWLSTKTDSSIEIATKWGYTYVANFDTNAKIHEIKEHSLEKLNAQWEHSKRFLPHLKVYQIHSVTLETGVLENKAVLERLAFLKKEYNIEIGLTTTGKNQIEVIKKALAISIDGKQLFDAFQVTYNILDQSLSAITNQLISRNKRIIIKEALANGRLFRNKNYSHYNNIYTALDHLAKNYNVGIDAIALNYCEQTIPTSLVLSGASNSEQLKQNLKMNIFSLSKNEIMLLNSFKTTPELYWSERKKLEWN